MKPRRATQNDKTITDTDRSLMGIVHNAFDGTDKMKSGLPSVMKDVKNQIRDLINRRNAAPNLQELFEKQGQDQRFSIQSMLTAMVFASIKQARSTRGSREPIFLGEVDLMLEKE